MYIANATGCSSIWGNSSPSTPYTVNHKGHGPAWSNSLFEDAAEFGYGMLLANQSLRNNLKTKVEAIAETAGADVKAAAQKWIDTFAIGAENGAATDALVAALEADGSAAAKEILEPAPLQRKRSLSRSSSWPRSPSGSSVVTDGATTSVTAELTTSSLPARTSTYSASTPKFTPIPADRLPRLLL